MDANTYMNILVFKYMHIHAYELNVYKNVCMFVCLYVCMYVCQYRVWCLPVGLVFILICDYYNIFLLSICMYVYVIMVLLF
jgi:hypothetical protein